MGIRNFRWERVAICIMLFLTVGWAQDDGDLSLQSVVRIAHQHNDQLAALRREVDAVKSRGITTWWPESPKLSIEWEGVPAGAGLGAYEERRLTFSQELEFPLNIYWRSRLAAQNLEAAQMHYAQRLAVTREEVILAYTHYLASRDRLTLAAKRVQLAAEFLQKAQIRRQAGEAPAVEVARAQVELGQAENIRFRTESEYSAAQAALNIVLGRDPGQNITAMDTLVYRRYEVAPDYLNPPEISEHPLLGESTARVKMAGQLHKLAWGGLLPSINLSAFRQNIGGDPDFYGMEIGLRIPLWFAFRQRGEIQEASALLSAHRHRHRAVKLRLLADIEQAYEAFVAARRQAENYHGKLLAPANEVYRIARRSYETGETGYLQMLESQQTLIDVRIGHVAVLADYYAAIAALEKAAGIFILE